MKLALRLAPPVALCLVATNAFAQPRVPPAAPAAQALRAAAARAPAVHAPAAAVKAPAVKAPAAKPAAAPAARTPDVAVKEAAVQWAKERNLPIREVEVGPPDRRVRRIFVPVTKEHWADFTKTFSSGSDRMMLKLKPNDNHLMPVVDETYHLWARNAQQYWGEGHENGGGPTAPAMIVALTSDEAKHVRQWFTHRAAPTDSLWCSGMHGCMDFIGNIEVAPGPGGTNTLRPIPRAEIDKAAGANGHAVKGGASVKVPMGKKLFDVLGIARSKDGRNMTYNMIHAANERIAVVGVPVGSDEGGGQTETRVIREKGRVFLRDVKLNGAAIERFANMTDDELLGPPPPQGVAGVVRPAQ